jgi:hypothetical protein
MICKTIAVFKAVHATVNILQVFRFLYSGSLSPMYWIVERIGAYYASTNMANEPRMQFLDHPGTRIFRRDWIRRIESRYPGGGKAILRVIPRMAEYKYQFNTRCLKML